MYCMAPAMSMDGPVNEADIDLLDATMSCDVMALSLAGRYQALINRQMLYSTECDDIKATSVKWRVINDLARAEGETEDHYEERYRDWAYVVGDLARRFGNVYPVF